MLKDADEFGADDLALFLGVSDSLELPEKTISTIDDLKPDFEVSPEKLADRIPFPGTQKTVINEDAGELIADRLVNECCRHAGIHPAAEPENHAPVTHLGADLRADALDEGLHGPIARATADAMNEVLNDDLALRGVVHLGMELHPVNFPFGIGNDRMGCVLRLPDGGEALGQFLNAVAMAVPDIDLLGQSLEER